MPAPLDQHNAIPVQLVPSQLLVEVPFVHPAALDILHHLMGSVAAHNALLDYQRQIQGALPAAHAQQLACTGLKPTATLRNHFFKIHQEVWISTIPTIKVLST